MAKRRSRFRQAAAMAHQVAASAHKHGNTAAAREAAVISRVATALANAEQSLDNQANVLISALASVGKTIKRPGKGPAPAGQSGSGYFVGITGGRSGFTSGYYTGLVGKRIGRGPVSVSPGKTTKAITAAFAKILAAQAQLAHLQSEVDRLKHRK